MLTVEWASSYRAYWQSRVSSYSG